MNVFVNAVSIKEGGPLVVLRNLISGMYRLAPHFNWVVAAPNADAIGDLSCCGNLVSVLEIDVRNPFNLLRWYELGLPAAVARLRSDVMFSLTNYLPIGKLRCPTILLEQHAGHFSSGFMELDRAHSSTLSHQVAWRVKNEWVRRSVRVAGTLVVQTASLADEIAKAGLRSRGDIAVIPHGPGQVSHASERLPRGAGKPWRIGYFSKFGVQKNFETLFRAIRHLSSRGHDVRLVVTLDPDYAPAARVLEAAKAIGIGDLMENQGEVATDSIESRYDSLDVMAFCSTCESFGFPMVEAMARGLPMVVADTPENREIAGRAAVAFSPYDYQELARQIEHIIQDEVARQARSKSSLERGRDYSWPLACEQTLSLLKSAATRGA